MWGQLGIQFAGWRQLWYNFYWITFLLHTIVCLCYVAGPTLIQNGNASLESRGVWNTVIRAPVVW